MRSNLSDFDVVLGRRFTQSGEVWVLCTAVWEQIARETPHTFTHLTKACIEQTLEEKLKDAQMHLRSEGTCRVGNYSRYNRPLSHLNNVCIVNY